MSNPLRNPVQAEVIVRVKLFRQMPTSDVRQIASDRATEVRINAFCRRLEGALSGALTAFLVEGEVNAEVDRVMRTVESHIITEPDTL